jgi:hypothetical protein
VKSGGRSNAKARPRDRYRHVFPNLKEKVMSLHVSSSGLSGLMPRMAMRAALAAVFIAAGLGMAAAQQGDTRQIQVLPAPGAQAPAAQAEPANAGPGAAAAPVDATAAEDAPPPQRRRPRRQQQAAPEPAEDAPPVAAAPADAPPPVGPVKPVVDKPIKAKPVAKPKPRYYEDRDYGYRPRYDRGGYSDGYRSNYGGGSRY